MYETTSSGLYYLRKKCGFRGMGGITFTVSFFQAVQSFSRVWPLVSIYYYYYKNKKTLTSFSCEIEAFVETHHCQLCVV